RGANPSSGPITFYLVNSDGDVLSPTSQPLGTQQERVATAKGLAAKASTVTQSYISPLSSSLVLGYSLPVDKLHMSMVAETRQFDLGGSNETGQFLLKLLAILAVGF